MRALVQHTCVLDSPLSIAEAREALHSAVSEVSSTSRLFLGEVSDAGFRIVRSISYTNSFIPVITGALAESDHGSQVTISMKMHGLVSLFMTIWLGFAKVFLVLGPIGALVMYDEGNYHGAIIFAAIPIALYVGGRAMLSFGFWREVKKAKLLLAQVLKAQDAQ